MLLCNGRLPIYLHPSARTYILMAKSWRRLQTFSVRWPFVWCWWSVLKADSSHEVEAGHGTFESTDDLEVNLASIILFCQFKLVHILPWPDLDSESLRLVGLRSKRAKYVIYCDTQAIIATTMVWGLIYINFAAACIDFQTSSHENLEMVLQGPGTHCHCDLIHSTYLVLVSFVRQSHNFVAAVNTQVAGHSAPTMCRHLRIMWAPTNMRQSMKGHEWHRPTFRWLLSNGLPFENDIMMLLKRSDRSRDCLEGAIITSQILARMNVGRIRTRQVGGCSGFLTPVD